MAPIVDNGVYVSGRRVDSPQTLDETFERMRELGGFAWIGLYRPSSTEIAAVAAEFGLHPLAVEDALHGHQRSKVERYGDTLFAVLRPARYRDAEEVVDFGELHLFVGRDFVVTIRHAESPDLGAVRHRMESSPELLSLGPQAVLYAVLDEVVDEYAPVVAGLENDIDEIEDALFSDDADEAVARRIYELSREVINFQRAVQPLASMLEWLQRGAEKYELHLELQRSLRDVLDHSLKVNERVASFRAILDNALTVHSALVARRQTDASLAQNEDIKKISGWAAILFAPTLVGTVYGMNFDVMPELQWELGYPFALALMVLLGVGLYAFFKAKRWF